MGDKPTYLGLLNAIALAEGRAHGYLTTWAARTDDPDVRRVLMTVAAREGEHAASFAKRLDELGYEVQPRPVPEREAHEAEVALSDRSDVEKLEALGYGPSCDPNAADIFDRLFADHTIDPITGALLGRYIAEERDSVRRLAACCAALRARAATA